MNKQHERAAVQSRSPLRRTKASAIPSMPIMKSFEQILLDNPPFYPDSSTDEKKMSFMFLLEDGRLTGDSQGRNHSVLMGWTMEDGGDLHQIERDLCEQNKALRVCFQPFSLKKDGTRGDFWAIYVQIDKVVPNDAQWTTLSNLYLLNGHRNTVATWDVYSSEKQKWEHKSESTLAELREFLNPSSPITGTPKKQRPSKRAVKP
jgi:hypothetical protein